MTPTVVSLGEGATAHKAVVLMTHRGIRAALVINEARRPVGVLSLADIVVHNREWGFHVERPGLACVRDMMTPVVFSIAPDAPPRRGVKKMVAL